MAVLTIRRIALLAFPLLVQLASATQQCYAPDGTESNDKPCSSDDSYQTFCCPSNMQCVLDPGPLCQGPSGYERGTCTVQDWSSGACPKFCLADNTDARVDRCTAKASNGNFCCGYDADSDACDCATNNNTFPLYAYSSIKVAPTAVSSSSSSSVTSATSQSSAETSALTSALTSATAASGTTQTPTSSPSASSSSDSGLSTGAEIGIGIAVPLGVIALGILGFLAWRQKKKSKLAAYNNPAELAHQPQGHQGYYDPPNEVKYAHEGSIGPGGYAASPNMPPSELYAPPPQGAQTYEMPASSTRK